MATEKALQGASLASPEPPTSKSVITVTLVGQHKGGLVSPGAGRSKRRPSLPCYRIDLDGFTMYDMVAAHNVEETVQELRIDYGLTDNKVVAGIDEYVMFCEADELPETPAFWQP